jgi:hypothetical protein
MDSLHRAIRGDIEQFDRVWAILERAYLQTSIYPDGLSGLAVYGDLISVGVYFDTGRCRTNSQRWELDSRATRSAAA